jgi:hypothetical protein
MSNIKFKHSVWEEKPFDEIGGGAKLTRCHVKQQYTGDMKGDSTIEYIMAYTTLGTASFVGLERFTGSLGDKSGSFVFQHVGKFENGEAKSSFTVVEGSNTGDLASLRGSGSYAVKHGEDPVVNFNYSFA